MHNKDALFELIKSLNQNEKRHFKLFASRHSVEKSNYIQLFEAIEKQKVYNEYPLLKKFSKTPISKNLNVIKHYLYKLILRSLHIFHANNSIDAQLKEQLHYIEILFKKGLYHQCKKNILLTQRLAEKYDKHLILAELLLWNRKVAVELSFKNITKKSMTHLYDTTFKIIDSFKNYIQYLYGIDQIYLNLMQKGPARKTIDIPLYQLPSNNIEKENTTSFFERFYYYDYHSIYFTVKNDLDNAYSFLKKTKMHIEKHPQQLAEIQDDYVDILYNITMNQLKRKKIKDALHTLQLLKTIRPASKRMEKIIFFLSHNLSFTIYNITGQFEEGIQLIEQCKKEFELNKEFFLCKQDEITFYYESARMYLGANNYVDANIFINKILNDKNADIRSDLFCFAYILHLIIFYEKKKFDLLEYRIKTVKNFLIRRKRLYKIEDVILNFIRRDLLRIYNHKQLISAFKVMRNDIVDIIKDPFEKKAIAYFDIISWLDSKIEGKTFAEVVRGKIS